MFQNRRPVIQRPIIVKPPQDASGVVYASVEGAPGLKMFECSAYRARLSQTGCGSRWREAQLAIGSAQYRFERCQGCAIGAQHAGEKPTVYSSHFGAPICPRCRKGGLRMVGGRICISCYNRELEFAKGRNARGNAPARLLAERPLHSVRYRVTVDGRTFQRQSAAVVDLLESVLQTMRTTKGELVFGFSATQPALAQGRLF